MIAAALVATVAAAPPTAAELKAAWDWFMKEPASRAKVLKVRPIPEEWQQLAKGEVLKWRLEAPAGLTDVVAALTYIDQPVDVVWVALLDDKHASLISDLTEYKMGSSTRRRKILYQRVDLPFPMSDRHWVLAIENNAALYKAVGGLMWERTWDLDPRGPGALVELPDSLRGWDADIIWPPVARGGWVLLRIGWGTLLFYHAQTNVGGYVPEDLVTRFAMAKLDEMMEQLNDLAVRAPTHYAAGHAPFYRPNGSVIAPFTELAPAAAPIPAAEPARTASPPRGDAAP